VTKLSRASQGSSTIASFHAAAHYVHPALPRLPAYSHNSFKEVVEWTGRWSLNVRAS